jgi:hypothetical protein
MGVQNSAYGLLNSAPRLKEQGRPLDRVALVELTTLETWLYKHKLVVIAQ